MLVLGVIPFCALATPAGAVLQFAVQSAGGVNTFFCADNQACDTNPAVGQLQISQTVGPVTITSTLAVASAGGLSVSTLDIVNNTDSTVSYQSVVSNTGYAGPVTNVGWSGSGTWQAGIGSTFTYNFYADALNGQGAGPGFATPGILTGSFSSAVNSLPDSFANTGSHVFDAAGPYSMTLEWTGSFAPHADLVSRGQVQIASNVPEPATWALMGIGFALMAGVGLRSRRRAAALVD